MGWRIHTSTECIASRARLRSTVRSGTNIHKMNSLNVENTGRASGAAVRWSAMIAGDAGAGRRRISCRGQQESGVWSEGSAIRVRERTAIAICDGTHAQRSDRLRAECENHARPWADRISAIAQTEGRGASCRHRGRFIRTAADENTKVEARRPGWLPSKPQNVLWACGTKERRIWGPEIYCTQECGRDVRTPSRRNGLY